MRRKHISLKTRCASLIVQARLVPYDDAKLMTEDQILSLFQVDHNILHESGHKDRDKFWNLTHMPILAHREKSKVDAAIIAKGRRIRQGAKPYFLEISAETRQAVANDKVLFEVMREAYWVGRSQSTQQVNKAWSDEANRPGGALRWRKLKSRGFDKTRKRKMDGTVVKR